MIIFNFKNFIIKILLFYVLKELCNLFKILYVIYSILYFYIFSNYKN